MPKEPHNCITCKHCKYDFKNPDSIGYCASYSDEVAVARKSCRGNYWEKESEGGFGIGALALVVAISFIACISLTGCAMSVEVKGIGVHTIFDASKIPVLQSK